MNKFFYYLVPIIRIRETVSNTMKFLHFFFGEASRVTTSSGDNARKEHEGTTPIELYDYKKTKSDIKDEKRHIWHIPACRFCSPNMDQSSPLCVTLKVKLYL